MSALNLAQSLIRIKSISPNDAGCFEIIGPELTNLGFKVEKIKELNSETLLAIWKYRKDFLLSRAHRRCPCRAN
jgi:acetylornithine deacetylase/succinyl-diaminopimelate desuccinylase-like protein